MKKILSIALILCCLLLTACNSTSIGIIGGADGPTKIYVGENNGNVKGQFGEQLEKKPVRMINVDGELYYDTGIESQITARCGTMDGNLKKTVKENEIPLKSGEANFEAEGYQNVTAITKEVIVDGKWKVFRKYESYDADITGMKYCYYIKGHLNKAAVDTEMIVLSEDENVTFNDIHDSLLSSQYPLGTAKGATHFNYFSSDKWGITLRAEDVTPKGMTLKIEQFGGGNVGYLHTGQWFILEKMVEDEWISVETNPLIDYAWEDIAYDIKLNDITHLEVEWKWLYGELPSGYYRMKKEISNRNDNGSFDKDLYEVYFTIE